MRTVAGVLLALAAARADVGEEVEDYLLQYRLYADGAYAWSSTRPANNTWRTKGTTWRLDELALNLAMAQAWKDPTADSRWGFELGAQAGRDSELAVPDENAISGADFWQHVYRASVTYLFPVGRGLKIEGGLLPGALGYESYLSIENPTYTRGYVTDYVPYFVFGIQGTQSISESLDLLIYVITGWDYLTDVNDVPGIGMQTDWRINDRVTYKQNLYFGPEQEDTDLEFWRFFSESVVEHRWDAVTIALAFDFGTQKLANEPGNPRGWVIVSAFWFRWDLHEHWRLGLRPEVYDDPDGFMTGSRQTLFDVSVALRYWFTPHEKHSFALSLEYRYDRSTGPEGGFFSGSNNELVDDQHVIILALTWSFTDGFVRP
ncbi:MAG: outer membrane beta-barrel protein [Planctomycetota bacterium]